MILPNMNRFEIARHLWGEVSRDMKRIANKANAVCKDRVHLRNQPYVYEQVTSSCLTLSIHVVDPASTLVVIGMWFKDGRRDCHAIVRGSEVIIYNPHFFERYAERYLKKPGLDNRKVAQHFFSKPMGLETIVGHAPESGGRVWLHHEVEGGLALGFKQRFRQQWVVVMQTFVADYQLHRRQLRMFSESVRFRENLRNFRHAWPRAKRLMYGSTGGWDLAKLRL